MRIETSEATDISRPVYLHFFDRQILTLLHLYDVVPIEAFERDFRLTLAATYEPLYVSAAMVLENHYVKHLFGSYRQLFQSGHVELVITEDSIPAYAAAKRFQYGHVIQEYQRAYFTDEWRQVAEYGPVFRRRLHDTGTELEESLCADLGNDGVLQTARRKGISLTEAAARQLSTYAIEAIRERRGSAITRHLYDWKAPIVSRDASRVAFDLQISEHYVRSYIAEYGGTICTGLTIGLEEFAPLSLTFPFHHLPLWHQLYRRLGIWPVLQKLDGQDWVALRDSPEFMMFVNSVRDLFRRAQAGRTSSVQGTRAHCIRDCLTVVRRSFHPSKGTPARIDEVLRFLEKTSVRVRSVDSDKAVRQWHPPYRTKMKDTVFVVYGRDETARAALFNLLRAAGLKPLEWEQAVRLTGKGSPYIGEILDAAFAAAQAVVVLFTGDDLAGLREELLKPGEPPEMPHPQPRPNVILEAGMAFGKYPDRTIIVEIGKTRDISDLLGRHVVRMDGSPERRKALLLRLESAGCAVDLRGDDWMKVAIV